MRGADLSSGDLSRADLTGARLEGADLTGVNWDGATCPDGTAADDNATGCVGNLDPSARRRLIVESAPLPVRPAPRWEPVSAEDVVEELRPEIPFVVLGPRVAIDDNVWVEVDTVSGRGWVDGRDLRPWSAVGSTSFAACETDAMVDAVAGLIPDSRQLDRISISQCADGLARIIIGLVEPPPSESEQVFLEDVAGQWSVVSSGTGIDCAYEPPGEQREICRRLGLWTPRIEAEVFFFDERRIEAAILPLTAPVLRDVSAHDPAFDALEELFRGPRGPESDLGLIFIGSEATGFADFTIIEGVARLTLTGGCNSQGSTFVVSSEIQATLTQFPDIDYVKIFDPTGGTAEPDGRSDSVPDCLQP